MKTVIFIAFLFSYLYGFEIEINNQPLFSITPNQVASVLNEFVEDLEKEENKLSKKVKKLKNPKPRKHKEIITRNGPGFSRVEIKEFVTNDDLQDDSNVPIGDNILFQNPIQMFDSMPMIFVKTTNLRKNLKNNTNPLLGNPFNIFSDLERQFDSFFNNLDDKKADNPVSKLTLNKEPEIKVIEFKDISPQNHNDKSIITNANEVHQSSKIFDSNKLINIIPAVDEENKSLEKIESNLEPKKESNEQQSKDIILNKLNNTINTKVITDNNKYWTDPLIITYIFYAILILIILFSIKFIFSKLKAIEETNLTNAEKKHSINEVEEELRGMKNKNKLF